MDLNSFMDGTLIGLPFESKHGEELQCSYSSLARSWKTSGFTTDEAIWYTLMSGFWASPCLAMAAKVALTTMSAGTCNQLCQEMSAAAKD